MLKESIQDFSSLGGNPAYLAAAFIFLITGNYREFWILAIALLIAYLITAAIRLTFWTERPDKQKYHNLWEKFDSGSFPSLHVARATILAITIAVFLANIWVYIAFACGVIAVCSARVYLKRHKPIDVTAGAVIGLIISWVAPQIINYLGIL